MSVYVDPAKHPFGQMIMCHMVSPDLDELHAMAERIGVRRQWFQNPLTMPKVSRPHYDIAKSKRALAVQFGAIEIDELQMSVISNVALSRLPGVPAEVAARDPLALFRRHSHARLAELEAWLAAQPGCGT